MASVIGDTTGGVQGFFSSISQADVEQVSAEGEASLTQSANLFEQVLNGYGSGDEGGEGESNGDDSVPVIQPDNAGEAAQPSIFDLVLAANKSDTQSPAEDAQETGDITGPFNDVLGAFEEYLESQPEAPVEGETGTAPVIDVVSDGNTDTDSVDTIYGKSDGEGSAVIAGLTPTSPANGPAALSAQPAPNNRQI